MKQERLSFQYNGLKPEKKNKSDTFRNILDYVFGSLSLS